MRKDKIIENAMTMLKEELIENGKLNVSIMQMSFLDTWNNSRVNGEVAGIRTDEYDEGFYYHPIDDNYYYYGEAILDNPGSFSNKFAFLIKGENLNLLPVLLKEALKRVGITKISETITTDVK